MPWLVLTPFEIQWAAIRRSRRRFKLTSRDLSPAVLYGRNARFSASQTTKSALAPCQLVWQERKIREPVNVMHLPDEQLLIESFNRKPEEFCRRSISQAE